MKYPKWPIYATSEQKTELLNLAKNEIVLRPKHGEGEGDNRDALTGQGEDDQTVKDSF